jgi:hypothetical protein
MCDSVTQTSRAPAECSTVDATLPYSRGGVRARSDLADTSASVLGRRTSKGRRKAPGRSIGGKFFVGPVRSTHAELPYVRLSPYGSLGSHASAECSWPWTICGPHAAARTADRSADQHGLDGPRAALTCADGNRHVLGVKCAGGPTERPLSDQISHCADEQRQLAEFVRARRSQVRHDV